MKHDRLHRHGRTFTNAAGDAKRLPPTVDEIATQLGELLAGHFFEEQEANRVTFMQQPQLGKQESQSDGGKRLP